MRRPLIGSLALAAAVSTAAVTQAHIALIQPSPRYIGDSMLKDGPCGVANDMRGATSTTFEPGQTITVMWDETIEHPGHYRILFAADGQNFPTPVAGVFCTDGQEVTPGSGIYCLQDNIPDQGGSPNYMATVTLPDVTCDNCTLQLIQYMDDNPADPVYHTCADLVLSPGGAGGSGGSPSTTTTTTGRGTTTTTTGAGAGGSGGDPGSGYDPYPDDEGGCAIGQSQGTTAAAALGALGLLALLGRRRRARG